jgi:hypothetical protein
MNVRLKGSICLKSRVLYRAQLAIHLSKMAQSASPSGSSTASLFSEAIGYPVQLASASPSVVTPSASPSNNPSGSPSMKPSAVPHDMMETDRSAWVDTDGLSWTGVTAATDSHCAVSPSFVCRTSIGKLLIFPSNDDT